MLDFELVEVGVTGVIHFADARGGRGRFRDRGLAAEPRSRVDASVPEAVRDVDAGRARLIDRVPGKGGGLHSPRWP
jgi:hypothetical protein